MSLQLAEVDLEQFIQQGKSNFSFIVEFTDSDCPACEKLEKELDLLNSNISYMAPIVKINCSRDKTRQICAKHKIQFYPSVKMFNPKDQSKGILFTGKKTTENIRQFIVKNHRRPFVHLKEVDSSSASIANSVQNGLFILTQQPKISLVYYKCASMLKSRAQVVIHTSYQEASFYKYKGSDLVDYLTKDAPLQIVAKRGDRYYVYRGNLLQDDIEKWIDQKFK